MRRDFDLIRKIVMAVEDHPHGNAPRTINVAGYDEEKIGYHCYLIVDAGLADGRNVSRKGVHSTLYEISRLTTAGHDFADAVRNETVWNKVMTKLTVIGSGASVEIVTQLATSFLKQLVGIG